MVFKPIMIIVAHLIFAHTMFSIHIRSVLNLET